jgi:hypothetical protein
MISSALILSVLFGQATASKRKRVLSFHVSQGVGGRKEETTPEKATRFHPSLFKHHHPRHLVWTEHWEPIEKFIPFLPPARTFVHRERIMLVDGMTVE